MKLYISILLLFSIGINAQTSNDTLYLKFDEKITINEYVDDLKNTYVNLSFVVKSKIKDNNSRFTTYNFEIDNLAKDFNEVKFNEIEHIVSKTELEKIKLKSLDDLSELSDCDLYFLLGDTNNIFLITERGNHYLKYKLIYLSTQRGWEKVNTN
jgi:hypothetical protein